MKKLRRSAIDRKIFGVCGGIAEYFLIDVMIIRMAVLTFCLLVPAGTVLYLLAALLIPGETQHVSRLAFWRNYLEHSIEIDPGDNCRAVPIHDRA